MTAESATMSADRPSEVTGGARRSVFSALAGLSPAILLAGLWTAWAAADGGYFPSLWYPSAIALVGLVAILFAAGGRGVVASRPARAALALLAGFVLWGFLSILWARSTGLALEESNRLLLLLATVLCVALLPWDERKATVLLAAWVVGIAAVMAVDLVGALNAGEAVRERFIAGRYLGPIGYPNGTAAVCAMAVWPALFLSSRRDLRPPIQVGFVALAVFLLECALIPESRASVLGLALAAVVSIALAPDRLRFVGRLLIVGGAAILAIAPIHHVYSVAIEIYYHTTDEQLAPVVNDAAGRMALTVAGAAVAASLLVVAERLVRPGHSTVRRLRLGAAGLAAVATLAAAGVAVAEGDRIADAVRDRVQTSDSEIESESDAVDTGPRIGTGLDSLRADEWRVALDVFDENRLAGAGTGNYADEYTKRRDQDYTYANYAHNLWLRALADNGLIGILLLVGALAALIGGLLAGWRRLRGAPRGVVAVAVAVLGYLLVHVSLDWVEVFPAISAPALCLPIVGLALAAGASGAARRRSPRPALLVAGVALAATAVVGLTLPYLSQRYVNRATETWRVKPARAFQDLERAADLNPLSSRPLVRKGTIATRLRRLGVAREAFHDALDVEDGWYAHFQLGLIEAKGENFPAARAEIRRALELNPRDPFVLEARDRVRRNRTVDPAAVNARIAEANRIRFTTRGN